MSGNVRVDLKPLHPNASSDQRERAFRGMSAAFKRKCNENGILTEINKRAYYESRSQKARRKRKEAESQRRRDAALQIRLRDNFCQG